MKLAEALILRADTQKRLGQIRQRLIDNAKVQEGDEPTESLVALFAQVDELCNSFQGLVKKINATNIQTKFEGDRTITDALAERDALAMKRNVYHEVIKAASIRPERYSRSEVRYQRTVDLNELQNEFDQIAKSYRELDMKIQEINWRTELVE